MISNGAFNNRYFNDRLKDAMYLFKNTFTIIGKFIFYAILILLTAIFIL